MSNLTKEMKDLQYRKTGIALALAWPQTKCKQAGAWYDGVMNICGLSQKGYYKVGHAAVVLINKSDGQCHYFDFGRYHAPHGFGRVRNAVTDHDLKMQVTGRLDKSGQLVNQAEILQELIDNKSCHGDGYITSSATEIHFEKAWQKAIEMQSKSPWKYGPFVMPGTNCSRFVRTVLLAGKPAFWHSLLLRWPLTISPSPSWNVLALGSRMIIKPSRVSLNKSNKPACQVAA